MNTKLSILIIEQEKEVCDSIETLLAEQGYKTYKSYSGTDGISQLTSRCPEILLLDPVLTDTDGMDIIRQVRSWSEMPVIIISSRSLEKDKVDALDLGADDYITRPFGTAEFLARVRAAARRLSHIPPTGAGKCHIYSAGGLILDFDRRRITVDGTEIHLTQVEYRIVSFLADHPGTVMTYDSIISHVWGPYAGRNNRILRVNMANIRRKIEKNPSRPRYIFTEIGIGYRMLDINT